MAVTIVKGKTQSRAILEVVDGGAYKDDEGIIYIGNAIGDVLAFSICGKYVLRNEYSQNDLVEIDLEILVKG